MVTGEKNNILAQFHFNVPGQQEPISIDVFENVYSPREDSFLLIDFLATLSLASTTRFLEIGVGTGIVSIFAARYGAHVTGTDINPLALENAQHNADKNGILLELIEGDLFEKVEGRFDIVVFNPPYLPRSRFSDKFLSHWEQLSLESGKSGMETTLRFINEIPRVMKRGGNAFFIASTLADIGRLKNRSENSLKLSKVEHIDLHRERLCLYKLVKE